MITSLQEIDAIIAHEIDEPLFLRNAARPDTSAQVFEWFRFADTAEGITHDCLDEAQAAQRGSTVSFNPIA